MKRLIMIGIISLMLVSAAALSGCVDQKRTASVDTSKQSSGSSVSTVTVPYGEETKISLDAPGTSEVYLTMTARANAKELGGGRSFMRVNVNGKPIPPEKLVNKNLNFTNGDGFKTSYYSRNMSAWYLFFSPDFVGYDNPSLSDHVLEGNAYVYKFDVSDMIDKGAPNEIVIENIGDEVAAQYADPKTIEYYKSAPIIVSPIKLEGKGNEVVQFTKEASPSRLIVGKRSTVTLKLTNNLPGSINDVQIADASLPPGLSGSPFSAKLDAPVQAGGSYSTTYEVTANAVGSYNLGRATITFADSTGNYQKLMSDPVTITVI
jgi:hypothetical protein